MTRKTKLLLNSTSSLMYQFVTLICGFILPRFFLASYGSAVNGLVSSITQFLGFISLAECGVGAVVQSTLYKPLADKDMLTVSKIVASSDRFFKRIAYLLLVYVAVLMVVYPLINLEQFDYIFTLILILVISISTFAQYYLGMTYKLLLNADQLGFIQYTIHAIALIINTVCCIVLMKNDVSVHIVKLTTSVIFLLQPLLLSFIAKRKYNLEYRIKLTEEPIKQKWNGMAQHVATVVLGNTDTVVLTLLSTLENVSIYGVYHLIVNGVKQIVLSTTNGMQAMLGNMLAKNEIEELNNTFDYIEWILHSLVTFAFSVAAILIIPFVQVYTADITDANYIVPVFAYLITLAQASYCIRLPYNIMVLAAGHYKQTQNSAIIEAVINVVLSVILVFKFGLIGVAIGTIAAMVYRTVYFAFYLTKDIIYRKIHHFVKHICIDICEVAALFLTVYSFQDFFTLQENNYGSWIVLAIKVAFTGLVVFSIINFISYKTKVNQLFGILKAKNKN